MKHLFRDSVTIYGTKAVDAYGKESWSGSTSYKGRFQLKSMLVIDPKGNEIQADAICYLSAGVTGLNANDRVDFGGISYRIVALEEGKDDMATKQFIKATLKRTSV